MSPAVWLAVAVGGALGSTARLAVMQAARALVPGWPWGTWAVNVLGSLAIGVLMAWFLARPAPDWVRIGLMTGVLGGFTTFSAFSLDTLELLRTAGAASAAAYVAASLLFGLAACALGLWLGRVLLA
ncbi:fluoride efflux transporter FluC [Panacagrimonas sp.]|uniref:fluoride efflux transporter FluC n=1 Tax=Panacagrimonas sp. TaxID=2480088 RepID=UPI003B51E677